MSSKIISRTDRTTIINEDGSTQVSETSSTTNIGPSGEPDFIKIYTKMWAEYNGIPERARELFLQLAIRMSYCNTADIKGSQLVNAGKPWSDSIMEALNIGESMYKKLLSDLVKCGAIKRVARGVYQINPSYAGKGEWKYNPKYNRGGVEDLVATFNFRAGTVNTKIVWADRGDHADPQDQEIDDAYRKATGSTPKNPVTIKDTKTVPDKTIPVLPRGRKSKKTPVPAPIPEFDDILPGQVSNYEGLRDGQ